MELYAVVIIIVGFMWLASSIALGGFAKWFRLPLVDKVVVALIFVGGLAFAWGVILKALTLAGWA